MNPAIDLTLIDRYDRAFVQQRLCCFSDDIQRLLWLAYLAKPTRFERNTYLRLIVEELAQKLSIPVNKLELNLSEEELRIRAKQRAQACRDCRRRSVNDQQGLLDVREYASKHGVVIDPELYELLGELRRYCDHKWWLRKLRKTLHRNIETIMHHLNQVNTHKSLYCSQTTLRARIRQKEYQEAYLSNTFATNEHGQRFSLLELSEKGVSNPSIRKGELMVRARGFEDLANDLGHVATFLTMTCPSKYHRSYATSGQENPKWQGYTPIEGQYYLNGIWKLIRSKLNRMGVSFYGFRVAEPQHDGTPHWHLLLFVKPEDYNHLVTVTRYYAMREDGDESGADQHRFTEVKIDPSKGSATGYIAKYISKNIDGSDLDEGIYGEDPRDAARRVDAWASCWGIRQFQQLGGCSVTVWRELRRLKSMLDLPEHCKAIFEAADGGDWKTFTLKMGGVFCARVEQVFKPFYAFSCDRDTGTIRTTEYSENELIRVLKGVAAAGREVITRIHEWRMSSRLGFGF